MLPRRILIVDDEPSWRRILQDNLAWEGYNCLAVASGPEALKEAPDFKPEIGLIDLMMPGMDGASLLKELRRQPATARLPIVVISNKAPLNILEIIEAGLSVPVLPKEVFQKILDAMTKTFADTVRRGSIDIDRAARTVRIGGKKITLSARELDLFCALLGSGEPVSREELLRRIWPDRDDLGVVDVTILRLRRHIAKQIQGISIPAVGDGFALKIDETYKL